MLVICVMVSTGVAGPLESASAGPTGVVGAISLRQDSPESSVADLLVNVQQLHPDVVATLRIDVDSLGTAGLQLLAARDDASQAQLRQRVACDRQALLRAKIVVALEAVRDADLSHSVSIRAVEESEAELSELAVSTFVLMEEGASGNSSIAPDTTSFEIVARESRVHAELQVDADRDVRLNAEQALGVALDELAELRTLLSQQVELEMLATTDLDVANAEIEMLEPGFESWLLGEMVQGTDIPIVVFDAYYKASLALEAEQSACGVAWHQLAGIGKVESRHGSFGGNTVGPDGRTDGEILGPLLDGEPFAAITDTDGGLLDGDGVWDRAVGPMQFIPGSWSIYGRDGNGDNVEDPHNMYDATLAAGAHLCGSAAGLEQATNFRTALFGYNHSEEYGVQVMTLADSYEQAVGSIVVASAEPIVSSAGVSLFK